MQKYIITETEKWFITENNNILDGDRDADLPNDAKKQTDSKCWKDSNFQAETTHAGVISQANLKADNIMEIRVLCCSKMEHKSCDRERMRNTAVPVMGTNSPLMSVELLYKHSSY